MDDTGLLEEVRRGQESDFIQHMPAQVGKTPPVCSHDRFPDGTFWGPAEPVSVKSAWGVSPSPSKHGSLVLETGDARGVPRSASQPVSRGGGSGRLWPRRCSGPRELAS